MGALGFLLAVLGFFKYAGFFVDSAARALSTIGFDVGDPVLAIVLPLGISFYTFMAMAYVVDVYRGDMAPVGSLVDYALFVAYFPHLVAGPILRAPALMPQFARAAHDPARGSVDRRLADRAPASSRRSSSPTTCRRWSTRCSRRRFRPRAATC